MDFDKLYDMFCEYYKDDGSNDEIMKGRIEKAFSKYAQEQVKKNVVLADVSESDLLLKRLFHHVDKPSKRWPKVTVGKRVNGKPTWFTGGVDDEFRDCLVSIEKHLHSR